MSVRSSKLSYFSKEDYSVVQSDPKRKILAASPDGCQVSGRNKRDNQLAETAGVSGFRRLNDFQGKRFVRGQLSVKRKNQLREASQVRRS
ncbi:hypothetical protein KZ483_05790 [Paenibacillus sp. sptzw28]|uniref:hypothetical protein n=1 Tax=Paenibacillus sp. sptzw28 TaxID=715179 RepID=UPI001C6EF8CA|nr:hypothetical protein [Paenibacillus sp. sptzw28]QYR22485.1 hypothetical protein KZ483_05790 [Paenibacillus sp. sptzw28]